MSGNSRFSDSIFNNIDINEAIERSKCRATGKVSFGSKAAAVFFIYWLKYRFKHRLHRADGSHIKRRNKGKPKQRRAYYCMHCGGYHITKWTEEEYQHRQKPI